MSLRMQKVNSQIQKILSSILSQYSEYVGFIVVNFVDTAKDLSVSRIYINFTSDIAEKQYVKLSKYFGRIQQSFANEVNFKKTPHLEFILDTKQHSIEKVEEILENLSK